ncbi:MAG: adenylyl-sulfate kinase [Aminipila sp.]
MKDKGRVFWITGLAGSGKTTIGRKLYEYLSEKEKNVVFLDGDELRNVYNDHDYSDEGRKLVVYRTTRLMKLLSDQGIDSICCIIGMKHEYREWNRANFENYYEIYLKVHKEELIRRDKKNLYSLALANKIDNVVGINSMCEEPKNPDIAIYNEGENTPDKVIKAIIEQLKL